PPTKVKQKMNGRLKICAKARKTLYRPLKASLRKLVYEKVNGECCQIPETVHENDSHPKKSRAARVRLAHGNETFLRRLQCAAFMRETQPYSSGQCAALDCVPSTTPFSPGCVLCSIALS